MPRRCRQHLVESRPQPAVRPVHLQPRGRRAPDRDSTSRVEHHRVRDDAERRQAVQHDRPEHPPPLPRHLGEDCRDIQAVAAGRRGRRRQRALRLDDDPLARGRRHAQEQRVPLVPGHRVGVEHRQRTDEQLQRVGIPRPEHVPRERVARHDGPATGDEADQPDVILAGRVVDDPDRRRGNREPVPPIAIGHAATDFDARACRADQHPRGVRVGARKPRVGHHDAVQHQPERRRVADQKPEAVRLSGDRVARVLDADVLERIVREQPTNFDPDPIPGRRHRLRRGEPRGVGAARPQRADRAAACPGAVADEETGPAIEADNHVRVEHQGLPARASDVERRATPCHFVIETRGSARLPEQRNDRSSRVRLAGGHDDVIRRVATDRVLAQQTRQLEGVQLNRDPVPEELVGGRRSQPRDLVGELHAGRHASERRRVDFDQAIRRGDAGEPGAVHHAAVQMHGSIHHHHAAGPAALPQVQTVEIDRRARAVRDQDARPVAAERRPDPSAPLDQHAAPRGPRETLLYFESLPEAARRGPAVRGHRDRCGRAVEDEGARLAERCIANLEPGPGVELHHRARCDGERRAVADAQVRGHHVRALRRRPCLVRDDVRRVHRRCQRIRTERHGRQACHARPELLRTPRWPEGGAGLGKSRVVRGNNRRRHAGTSRKRLELHDCALDAQPVAGCDAHP